MMNAIKASKLDDPNAAKHILCMSKKLGYQDSEGKLVISQINKALSRTIRDKSKLEEVVSKCGVDKDSPEETAVYLWTCTYEVRPPDG